MVALGLSSVHFQFIVHDRRGIYFTWIVRPRFVFKQKLFEIFGQNLAENNIIQIRMDPRNPYTNAVAKIVGREFYSDAHNGLQS